jgi:3-oxoacyl-[acyl-carrier-protein] synthase II
MSDVVFTGIGVISPIGIGKNTFWDCVRRTKSGIKKITGFDTHMFHSNIAGCIDDFDPGKFMPPKVYRRLSRISRMAVAASKEAIEDSGLDLNAIDTDRIAIIAGTSYGSSSRVDDFYTSLLKDGPRGAEPFLFPETVPNAPASHIAMFHGITGPNTTFCQNEISVENSIMYARNLLMQKKVDIVLVGGADELSQTQYAAYNTLGALNLGIIEKNGSGRPMPGSGIVLGEGAGVLVMERKSYARRRRAGIYGALKSITITGGRTSIGHYEADGGSQMRRAMSATIQEAGLSPDQIDQIDVSANYSTELDAMEYQQIASLFAQKKRPLCITPLKYLMGDFGGAGAIRAAAILLSLKYQISLPMVDLSVLQGNVNGHMKWRSGQKSKIHSTLMTTSTFGGGSASLIFTND